MKLKSIVFCSIYSSQAEKDIKDKIFQLLCEMQSETTKYFQKYVNAKCSEIDRKCCFDCFVFTGVKCKGFLSKHFCLDSLESELAF